jgi:hypothetical protein
MKTKSNFSEEKRGASKNRRINSLKRSEKPFEAGEGHEESVGEQSYP